MLGFAFLPDATDMPDYVRDELLRNIETLRQEMLRGLNGIIERLEKQNGRVGALEKRESAHHERIGALEVLVKAIMLPDVVPHPSRKRVAITLSLGAGTGAVILELLHRLLGAH